MTFTEYNKDIHDVRVCNHCQGKGRLAVGIAVWKRASDCEECMGIGLAVFSGGTQIRDRDTAQSIVVSLVQQYTQQQQWQSDLPSLNPLNPLGPRPFQDNPWNPTGWSYPNNPFWRAAKPSDPPGTINPRPPRDPGSIQGPDRPDTGPDKIEF